MYEWQNYHRHSHYTNTRISDSVATNEDYAKRAVELGQTILSTCEHGWQGNYAECYELAKEHGLKMLFASEAYWVKDRYEKDNSNCHIILAAKNENGRQSINDVLSEANLTGFYGRPRVDIPLIMSLPKDDVWVTSACVAGWKYEDADDIYKMFAQHFGNNFMLEVQYHDTKTQIDLNYHILKLRDEIKCPIIMGCDSHYILQPDAQTRSDFLLSKNISYPDEDGWYLDMPDGDTAYNRFAKQGVLSHDQIIEAISNTNVFKDVQEYVSPIFNTDIKMPSMYPEWSQEQKDEEYKRLVWSGWEKYKTEISLSKHEHYEKEIASEIQTVVDTHMADYFIDNYHIIKKGIENGGRLTRTGRGSAVSFITNKLLGFTEVDRIAATVHMYPERFMSTTRILESGSLPDIDFNIADPEPFAKAQQQVLGEDHAYPMIAYGTMLTSAAWKLYAKSQGIPFEIANAVSEQIKKYEFAVKHADEEEKDSVDIYSYISPQYKDIFEKSKKYKGTVTSWSIAPCSYLLYQGSIRKEIGLVRIKDNICCCMDGHWAERCHFLKNDLLTVQVVNLIYKVFESFGEQPPTVNELLKMCAEDEKPWDLYKRGATLCLNQVEKPGTSARAGIYQPRNISELAAFVAAIRPGFKSMYKTFESRVPFSYGVKAFDDLIQTKEMPNSFILYQEQEMQALHFAGIPMSDCYTAIKNIAKKRKEKVLAYKEKFKTGLNKTMVEDEHRTKEEADEMSDKLWQIMEDSANYSFNASHAYCVALDSLYEAWLKANHPLEFYETALNLYEDKGDKDKVNDLKQEAEDYFGIHFLPIRFRNDNRKIRADLKTNSISNSISSIKGFSKTLGQTLYECGNAQHKDFISVLRWLDKKSVKSAKIDPLIKIDYFQEFGNNATLLRILSLWDYFKQGQAKNISKDDIPEELAETIKKYSTDIGTTGNVLKRYNITDINGLLEDLQDQLFAADIPELEYRVRAENQKDILGYVDLTTGKEEDRRKLYVLSVMGLTGGWKASKEPWIYKAQCKSIGSGKVSSLSIYPALYKAKPISEGSIIYADKVQKYKKGYWQLLNYDVAIG